MVKRYDNKITDELNKLEEEIKLGFELPVNYMIG